MSENLPEDTSTKKVCIACKQEFSGEITNCPHDGTMLTPVSSEPVAGSIIAGKYEVLSVVGGGAMGLVYKARHTLMKRIVAVKVLRPNMALDETTVSRFQKESEALSVLDHPNILTVFDFGLNELGQPYLVTDYLEGETLAEILNNEETLDYKRVIDLFKQVSSALSHAHKNGVVHRDMKPSNIMLVKNEENEDRVKILDFGIAKVTDETEDSTQLTKTGEVFGSPLYMSPEQCRGKVLDARSDIYSVGCVAYRALTGVPPIVGQDLIECLYKHVNEDPAPFSEARPGNSIPFALEAVVLKCLMKDPATRYQTMAELRDALITAEEKSVVSDPASIPTPNAPPPIEPPTIKNPMESALVDTEEDVENKSPIPAKAPSSPPANKSSSFTTSDSKSDTNTAKKKPTKEIGSLRSNLTEVEENKIMTLLKNKKVLAGVVGVLVLIVFVPISQNMFGGSSTKTETKDLKPEPGGDKYSTFMQKGIDEYETGDYFEARTQFQKAYAEATKNKLAKEKISSALHHLISASGESHEYEMAKSYLKRLEKLAGVTSYKEDPTSLAAAETYQDRALLLMFGARPNLKEAQKLTQKARNFYESHEGYGSEIMRCLSTLGQIKILDGDFEAASSYMNQAVMIAKEDPTVSQLEMAIRMDGLGDSYILLTNRSRGKDNYYDEAKKQYSEALKLRKDMVGSDDDKALSQSYLRLGIINYLQENYKEAWNSLEKSLSIREKHGRPLQIAEVKRAMSKVLLGQKKKDEARRIFDESIAIAKESGPQTKPLIKKWKATFEALYRSVR